MPTRNLVLTDHQHEMIDTLVRSGRYQNASEVLRERLRLIEQREAEEAIKLEALRRAAEVGWDHVAADRYRDVSNDNLEDFIGQLGNRAGEQVCAKG